MIAVLIHAIGCGAWGHMIANHLTDDGMILDWWRKLFEKSFNPESKIHNMMWRCSKCVGGQIFLWTFLGFFWYIDMKSIYLLFLGLPVTFFSAILFDRFVY